MSSSSYAIGIMLLALTTVSLAVTGLALRRLLLPAWSDGPAHLAEAVIALTVLIVISELLGTVDAFRRWALVASTIVVALAMLLLVRLRPAGAAAAGIHRLPEPPTRDRGFVPTLVATVAVTCAVTNSTKSALDALHGGILSFDSLWYHLPFAARFVQDASVTHLHYVGNAPTSFYPANSELVHAVGMLLLRDDFLSPLVNVGWLGLALLSAWCIGRPWSVAPATTTAVALVAFLPIMGGAQAGTAGSDMGALTLLLASVAILVNAPRSRSALFVAALAAGLAAGTRLNLWASVIALTAVVLLVAGRGRRATAAWPWMLGLAVGSAFWYVRNAVEAGNPVPWFSLKIPGLLTLPSTTPPVDCGTRSVAHYATDPAFVKAHLVPQLHTALGARWWLVLLLPLAGVAAALLARPTPMTTGLAFVAVVSGVAYLFTPATAGGDHARCFAFNTRFAAPGLALGMIVLPLALAQWRRGPLVATFAFALALAVTIHVQLSPGPLLTAIALLGSICVATLGRRRRLPRPVLLSALVCLAAGLGVAGWHEQQIYLRNRYAVAKFAQPIENVVAVLRSTTHARIAVVGFAENYPFYEDELSNRVEYPARRIDARFFAYSTCRTWLLALQRGRYDYVVTARQGAPGSTEARWTLRYPGAVEVLASPPQPKPHPEAWRWQLFRLEPGRRVDAQAACSRTVAKQPAINAAGSPREPSSRAGSRLRRQ